MKNIRIAVKVSGDLLISIEAHDYRMEDPAAALERQRIAQDLEMCLKELERVYRASGRKTFGQQCAECVRLRYGLGDKMPMTLAEIGKLWKLSRERIRQIEEVALLRLRRIAVKFGIAERFRMPSLTVLTPGWEVKK